MTPKLGTADYYPSFQQFSRGKPGDNESFTDWESEIRSLER